MSRVTVGNRIAHDFGGGLMPVRAAVTCKRCGVQMRRTGQTFPHVVFRRKDRTLWTMGRPNCVKPEVKK